ncbi:MAG: methylmalonyl-CoA mutase family protein, partial [Acidobacteria bacterium]|nr:methylmalonyl-CoA mutase family protein [Acidobacteriota bacterium]
VERLKRHRAGVDSAAVEAALNDIESAARSKKNLLPVIIPAVRVGATVGGISGALRRVFGTHSPNDDIG